MGLLGHNRISDIIEKAWADAAFRARFVADPKGVLAEFGVPSEDETVVEVLEDTPERVHMVIPLETPVNHRLMAHAHYPHWVFYAECENRKAQVASVVLDAWAKPELKARLVASPLAVLAEHGIDMGGREVTVVENTEHSQYIVLPLQPVAA